MAMLGLPAGWAAAARRRRREVEDRQLPEADRRGWPRCRRPAWRPSSPRVSRRSCSLTSASSLGGELGPAPVDVVRPAPSPGRRLAGRRCSPHGVQSPLTLVTSCLHNRTGKWDPTAVGCACSTALDRPTRPAPLWGTESGFVGTARSAPFWVSSRNAADASGPPPAADFPEVRPLSRPHGHEVIT